MCLFAVKSQYVNGFEGSVMTKIPKNFNFVTKTAPVRRIYLLMFFGVALYTADKANLCKYSHFYKYIFNILTMYVKTTFV